MFDYELSDAQRSTGGHQRSPKGDVQLTTAQAESTIPTTIPTGTWQSDPVHSNAGFTIKHAVGTFRGHFDEFNATLANENGEARLVGLAPVSSVKVKEENLYAHLLSPEFFDAERHPEVTFESRVISVRGDQVEIAGDLTIKDVTKPVVATGEINGPAPGPGGDERLGIDLETAVNRYDYGLEFQMDLPGGGKALGDEVNLEVHLELIKA
jgi:polyisoprenoid-binding protein YceI